MRTALWTCLVILAAPAAAQQTEPAAPRRTEIDFRELELRGQLRGPTIGRVDVHESAPFVPLITLRTDFDAEIARSARAVR